MTRRRWLAAGSIGALVLAALAVAWSLNALGIRAMLPTSPVAVLFDKPPPYPGYSWTRDGRVVGEFELVTIAGPEHCDWQTATFMFIAWPPGTTSMNAAGARQYIRDPRGVFEKGRYRELLDLDAELPADARPTGHRLGSVEIHVSPSDQDDAIYLVGPGGAERWPRAHEMILCA